jgi:hypothetical protein
VLIKFQKNLQAEEILTANLKPQGKLQQAVLNEKYGLGPEGGKRSLENPSPWSFFFYFYYAIGR